MVRYWHKPGIGFAVLDPQYYEDESGYVAYEDYAALEAECDALWSTYVALVDKLGIDTEKAKKADGKPSDVIVSYVEALRAENASLRAEQGERQEAFVWMRPDGDESFELTSEGDYLSFPLYRAPQPGPDVRGLVSADDVRDACANAVSVFAEEENADQCREVAEYMREVLLALIARRTALASSTGQEVGK